ncbi:MAG: DUF3333 domain-containing protein, partial [Boseongicola sp. SB0662_bin_57]|nr:DUF3333 domain-containing protein [Boseongicola sp. SB0662_bin_57]
MADVTAGTDPGPKTGSTADLVRASLARRNRKQTVLQVLGLGAISFAFLMLFILIASLVSSGY